MLTEIGKLEAIRAVGLPADLMAQVAPKVVTSWRIRAAVLSPSHFRDAPTEVRWVLLCALLIERQWEITDTLVELLISTVHAINVRADRRVTEEMVASFKRVRNKSALLARISEASLDRPDEVVREVVFPVAGARRHCGRWSRSSRPTVRSFAATCRSSCAVPTPTTTGWGW